MGQVTVPTQSSNPRTFPAQFAVARRIHVLNAANVSSNKLKTHGRVRTKHQSSRLPVAYAHTLSIPSVPSPSSNTRPEADRSLWYISNGGSRWRLFVSKWRAPPPLSNFANLRPLCSDSTREEHTKWHKLYRFVHSGTFSVELANMTAASMVHIPSVNLEATPGAYMSSLSGILHGIQNCPYCIVPTDEFSIDTIHEPCPSEPIYRVGRRGKKVVTVGCWRA
ncbi:hypothetical protein EDD17DRAFT_1627127 [Pisolithus thermaeus]|nr:hypothetical protein EV401DRAFT_1994597 [Pisolithus croceorrhizus]KAI6156235.1 hypothetical protein EDD17DRAFT_1627127 [Pisolithus thermaeus]